MPGVYLSKYWLILIHINNINLVTSTDIPDIHGRGWV